MFFSTVCDFAPKGINQFGPVSIVSMHETTEKADDEEETSFIDDKKGQVLFLPTGLHMPTLKVGVRKVMNKPI